MKKKPNILLITSDQQHFSTIGAFNPGIKTPNLDALISQGTYFDRAYCPNPTCTPTRASMITGKYPSQHGAWTLGTWLPEDQPMLGDALRGAGYRSALVGKAHFQPLGSCEGFTSLEGYPQLQDLDFWRGFHGPFYGFDHVELARNHTNEAHVGQHYALWMKEKGCANWRDYFLPPTGCMPESERRVWAIPEEYHYDAWIAERSCALMEEYRQSGEPFFLWASFFDPHPDYFAPEPWASMYDPSGVDLPGETRGEHLHNPPHYALCRSEDPDFSAYYETGHFIHGFHSHLHDPQEQRKDIAVYYGMVSMMDHYIGRILARLEESGLSGDTVVVFTTDHGHLFGQHGLIAKGPFLYEDLIRVPMVVRYPGRVPAGRICPALQSLVDFAPTMLDIAGQAAPPEMTGVSQRGVWYGESPSARDFVLCQHHHEPNTIHETAYVDGRFKIIVYKNQRYGELRDLEEDPGEVRNLWDDPAAAALKSEMLLKFAFAQMAIEPMRIPRIHHA